MRRSYKPKSLFRKRKRTRCPRCGELANRRTKTVGKTFSRHEAFHYICKNEECSMIAFKPSIT